MLERVVWFCLFLKGCKQDKYHGIVNLFLELESLFQHLKVASFVSKVSVTDLYLIVISGS